MIGRTLDINGITHEIVGVLPETFSFGYLSAAAIDLYVPYPTSPEYTVASGEFANVRRVNALARLAPGAVPRDGVSPSWPRSRRRWPPAHPGLYRTNGAAAGVGVLHGGAAAARIARRGTAVRCC